MSSPVIAARSVAKTYTSGQLKLKVLQNADLAVSKGEFVSIQGESGCGKTTLLNLLAGLETPDAGSIEWAGDDVSRFGRDRLSRRRGGYLGIVFQSYYLVPELNAVQNVLLNLRIAESATGVQGTERARDMLDRVGLGEREKQLPGTLSGGERQRVAIARALVTRPEVILADEPTGNLDQRTGDQIMKLLQDLCRQTETALVLVTHNAEHAGRADRPLILGEGILKPGVVRRSRSR